MFQDSRFRSTQYKMYYTSSTDICASIKPGNLQLPVNINAKYQTNTCYQNDDKLVRGIQIDDKFYHKHEYPLNQNDNINFQGIHLSQQYDQDPNYQQRLIKKMSVMTQNKFDNTLPCRYKPEQIQSMIPNLVVTENNFKIFQKTHVPKQFQDRCQQREYQRARGMIINQKNVKTKF